MYYIMQLRGRQLVLSGLPLVCRPRFAGSKALVIIYLLLLSLIPARSSLSQSSLQALILRGYGGNEI
jgi:hypothetical protein